MNGKRVDATLAREGMILLDDLIDKTGGILVRKGLPISKSVANHLRKVAREKWDDAQKLEMLIDDTTLEYEKIRVMQDLSKIIIGENVILKQMKKRIENVIYHITERGFYLYVKKFLEHYNKGTSEYEFIVKHSFNVAALAVASFINYNNQEDLEIECRLFVGGLFHDLDEISKIVTIEKDDIIDQISDMEQEIILNNKKLDDESISLTESTKIIRTCCAFDALYHEKYNHRKEFEKISFVDGHYYKNLFVAFMHLTHLVQENKYNKESVSQLISLYDTNLGNNMKYIVSLRDIFEACVLLPKMSLIGYRPGEKITYIMCISDHCCAEGSWGQVGRWEKLDTHRCIPLTDMLNKFYEQYLDERNHY